MKSQPIALALSALLLPACATDGGAQSVDGTGTSDESTTDGTSTASSESDGATTGMSPTTGTASEGSSGSESGEADASSTGGSDGSSTGASESDGADTGGSETQGAGDTSGSETGSEGNVTTVTQSTAAFNHISIQTGTPDLYAWNGDLLLGDVDRVAVFDREPDLSTYEGFIRDVDLNATDAATGTATGDGWAGLGFADYLIRGVAVGGDTAFARARRDGVYYLLSISPQGVATEGAAWDIWDFRADEHYIYSFQEHAGEPSIVRREHDGAVDVVLGTYEDGPSGLGRRKMRIASGGHLFHMPRDAPSGESGTIVGFAPDGTRFNVSQVGDFIGAALAIAGDTLVIAADGIYTVPLGETEPNLLVERASLHNNLPFEGTCATRYEYGQGGGLAAEPDGFHLLCRSVDGDQALLSYDLGGELLHRYDLPESWRNLGPLALTETHFCALEHNRWSRSPKRSQLRCWSR